MDDETLKGLGFGKEVERKNADKCVFCAEPVVITEFRTPLDLKEYQISGMCQKCQDGFFE